MSNAIENLKLRSGSMSKPPLGIVPMRALVGVSRVLEDGYVFYAPGNWAEQPLADAAQAYDNGEMRHRAGCQPINGLMSPAALAALDPDSDLPHIDHQIAGLVILRSLMIRDGVLPEDPGQGKRKRAANVPKIQGPGDPGYRFAYTPELCEKCAALGIIILQHIPHVCGIAFNGTAEGNPTPSTVPVSVDPDDARRAETEENLQQMQEQQRKETAQRAKHERRCLRCNGNGRVPSAVDFLNELACPECKGTGERAVRAEGMKW